MEFIYISTSKVLRNDTVCALLVGDERVMSWWCHSVSRPVSLTMLERVVSRRGKFSPGATTMMDKTERIVPLPVTGNNYRANTQTGGSDLGMYRGVTLRSTNQTLLMLQLLLICRGLSVRPLTSTR